MWTSKGVWQYGAIFRRLLICPFTNSLFRFFDQSRDAFSFYFGAKFIWNILALACTFFLIQLVRYSSDLFFRKEFEGEFEFFCCCLISDISTFWLGWHHNLLRVWSWFPKYLHALFVWKTGHRTIRSIVKLFIRIELAKLTIQTAEILHFDVGKRSAAPLLRWIRDFDFEFGNIHKGMWGWI